MLKEKQLYVQRFIWQTVQSDIFFQSDIWWSVFTSKIGFCSTWNIIGIKIKRWQKVNCFLYLGGGWNIIGIKSGQKSTVFLYLGGGEGARKDCPRGGTGGCPLKGSSTEEELFPFSSGEWEILSSREDSLFLLLLLLLPPPCLSDFLLARGVGHRAATGSLKISA